jgi:integrase
MTREALTIARAISLWEGSLRASRKAERTIAGYIRAIVMVEDEVGRHTDPSSITTEDLEAVIATWRGISATTAHNRIVAWRQFFAWGRKRYAWPDPTDALVLPRKDQPELRRLTPGEVAAILDAPVDPITRTAVHVLAYTGLRRGELMALRWGDIDLLAGTLRVDHRTAKGRKGRLIPIPPPLVDHLAETKDARGRHAEDDCYVFPRRDGFQFVDPDRLIRWREPASDNAVDRAVKDAARAAGVRNAREITSHMFRRHLLEQLLEQGTTPYIAAALAGHASIQTTAQYGGGASLRAVRDAVGGVDFVRTRRRTVRNTNLASTGTPDVELVGFEPTAKPDTGHDADGPGRRAPQVTPPEAGGEAGS